MKKVVMLVFVLVLLLAGCSSEISFEKIEPEKAYERLQNEEILLLDVRTDFEYADGHIPGSELLPYDLIPDQMETLYPDKEQTIFVYCRSGNRSETAANSLVELGYSNVFDLGGIINWPYDIEK